MALLINYQQTFCGPSQGSNDQGGKLTLLGSLPALIAGASGIGDGDADKLFKTVCKWPKNIADLLEYLECEDTPLSDDCEFAIIIDDDCGSTFSFLTGLSVGDSEGR